MHHNGNGSKITSECGTETAKALQEKLSGDNGTGDTKSPSHKLDASDPFQECEMLDIDQIEGRSNGDLVHVLSNGEYAVSYQGIMKLATKHNIDFPTVIKDNKAVIAYARKDSNSRADRTSAIARECHRAQQGRTASAAHRLRGRFPSRKVSTFRARCDCDDAQRLPRR